MQEFIENLYEIPNFKTYIAIIIAVLVVLFIIVLLTGKKDKKLEETKRLEKINLDAFKENSTAMKVETPTAIEPVSVESNSETIIPIETSERSLISDKLEEINNIKNSSSEVSEEVNLPELKNNEMPDTSVLESISQITNSPILEPVKEQELQINNSEVTESFKPIETEIDLPKIKESNIAESVIEPVIPVFTPNVESNKESFNVNFDEPNFEAEASVKIEEPVLNENIVLPEFDFEAARTEIKENISLNSQSFEEPKIEVAKKTIGMPVFSSVYAPKKENVIIDLTGVSKTNKTESNQDFNTNSSFDQIMGETYDISK